MRSEPTPHPAFTAMLQTFIGSLGSHAAAPSDSAGFEFESDGHVVRCFPNPADAERYVIECDVAPLDDAQRSNSALLTLIHQINESTWLDTGWLSLIDADGLWLIARSKRLDATRAEDLSIEICDALEHAAALRQVLNAQSLADLNNSATRPSGPFPGHFA